MAEFWRQAHWVFRGVFLALALFLLFVRLLPLGNAPGSLLYFRHDQLRLGWLGVGDVDGVIFTFGNAVELIGQHGRR